MPNPHEQISAEIEKIVATRNPFSLLLSLGRVAETLGRVDDELIDGIERTFTDSTQESYKKVLSAYKKDGFFTYLSRWAMGSGRVAQYRRELDRYFDASFSFDLDFFFFCLRQDKTWGAAMIVLAKLAKDPALLESYFSAAPDARRAWIAERYTPARNLADGSLREVTVIINNLAESGLPAEPMAEAAEQDEEAAAALCREIAVAALRDDPKGKRAKFLTERVANTTALNRRLIDALPDSAVIRILTYLRRGSKLIAASEKSDYWQDGSKVEGFVRQAAAMEPGSRDLRALMALEGHVRKYRANRDFFFAKFRYRFLNLRHGTLLDMVFGVPDLPRDEFYQLKRRTDGADPEDFGVLRQVKELVVYLQKNWMTQLLLPFFLRRLARRFNASNANYWLVKFVLAMVLPQGYSEYRQVMAFYAKLEAHWAPGWRGIGLRVAQFGWAIVAVGACAALFPMGVLAGAALFGAAGAAERVTEKRWPALHANLNFQVRAAAVGLGSCALLLGATMGLKDNLSLAYRNFQGTVNALTLPASETLALLGQQMRLMTADVLDAGSARDAAPRGPSLADVDYLAGKGLTDLRGATAAGTGTVSCAAPAKTPAAMQDAPATFTVRPGNTFWDEAARAARACGADVDTKAGQRALYLRLAVYLESNRPRLTELSRAPVSARLPAMDLPRYLPAGTAWDLAPLRQAVCAK